MYVSHSLKKSSTPCGEVNNTSTLINIKYSEPFWVEF